MSDITNWDKSQEDIAEGIAQAIAANVQKCLPLKAGWKRMGWRKQQVVLTVWANLVLKELGCSPSK